jgi:hypothetical protein
LAGWNRSTVPWRLVVAVADADDPDVLPLPSDATTR